MSYVQEYDFENLVNETERLVVEEMERQLESDNSVCRCQECVLDMAAYALNNIKPLYRVSLMGSLYASTLDETKYAGGVKNSVRMAIRKVHGNPSHS